MEMIADLDLQWSQWINGFHAPWADPIMIFLSEKWVWLPLYAMLLWLMFQKFQLRGFLVRVLALAMAVALSDQTASALLKPRVMRLRPCHQPELVQFWHIPHGCGGMYGFASSHAANAFCLAWFVFLIFPRPSSWNLWLFVWAFLIAWSRIYLAAHFLGDVVAGGCIGTFWAWFFFILIKNRKWILEPG